MSGSISRNINKLVLLEESFDAEDINSIVIEEFENHPFTGKWFQATDTGNSEWKMIFPETQLSYIEIYVGEDDPDSNEKEEEKEDEVVDEIVKGTEEAITSPETTPEEHKKKWGFFG